MRDEVKDQAKLAQEVFEDGAEFCKKLNEIMSEDEHHTDQQETGNVYKTMHYALICKWFKRTN